MLNAARRREESCQEHNRRRRDASIDVFNQPKGWKATKNYRQAPLHRAVHGTDTMPPDGKLGGKERPTDEIRPSAGRVHNNRTRGIPGQEDSRRLIPGATIGSTAFLAVTAAGHGPLPQGLAETLITEAGSHAGINIQAAVYAGVMLYTGEAIVISMVERLMKPLIAAGEARGEERGKAKAQAEFEA